MIAALFGVGLVLFVVGSIAAEAFDAMAGKEGGVIDDEE